MKNLSYAILIGCIASQAAHAGMQDKLKLMYTRLAGVPPTADEMDQMLSKVREAKGDFAAAASVATDSKDFINVTVKHMFCPMSNRAEIFLVPRTTGYFKLIQGTTVKANATSGCMNDFVATAMGVVRDDLSAKELLTGNFFYKADLNKVPKTNNQTLVHVPNQNNTTTQAVNLDLPQYLYQSNVHYEYLEYNHANYADVLIKQEPQMAFTTNAATAPSALPAEAAAGLLTTQNWAREHMIAGTNRRNWEFAAQEFLCTPIKDLKDLGFAGELEKLEQFIRKDVDKDPEHNAEYLTSCIGCHGSLDRTTQAFAYFDFIPTANDPRQGKMIYNPNKYNGFNPNNKASFVDNAGKQLDKMNHFLDAKKSLAENPGYVTTDDQWENFFIYRKNAKLGWRGPTSGKGVHSLGEMLANSQAFSSCMVKRVFTEVCRRAPRMDADAVGASEAKLVDQLAAGFESGGYKLKSLFGQVAALPQCTGE